MKKFLIKVLGFSSVFILIISLFIHIGKMYYCNVEYPMWKSKKEFLAQAHDSKNLVIGDSRALEGILPNKIGNNFYNMALGGATPVEGYYTLRRYLEANRPQKIIISYAPFHLRSEETFYDRTLKFGYLTNADLWDFCQVVNQVKQTINGAKLESVYARYHYFLQYFLALNDVFYAFRTNLKKLFYEESGYLHNKDIYREITSQEGQHYFGTNPYFDDLNDEAKLKHFKDASVIINIYLRKLIELALDNNIRVYYINAPFNEASARALMVDFVADYNDYMQKLKNLYPQVDWHSDLHYYSNNCFGDRSHLNHYGSQIFSEYVSRIVSK